METSYLLSSKTFFRQRESKRYRVFCSFYCYAEIPDTLGGYFLSLSVCFPPSIFAPSSMANKINCSMRAIALLPFPCLEPFENAGVIKLAPSPRRRKRPGRHFVSRSPSCLLLQFASRPRRRLFEPLWACFRVNWYQTPLFSFLVAQSQACCENLRILSTNQLAKLKSWIRFDFQSPIGDIKIIGLLCPGQGTEWTKYRMDRVQIFLYKV